MKFARCIAVTVALISCAGLAQAATVSLGNTAGASVLLNYGDIGATPNPVTFGISDNWYFNIASSVGVQTLLSLYAGGAGLTATLFQCATSACLSISTVDSVAAGNSVFDSLTSGFYQVSVTGSGQTYAAYVTAIPLPAAVWLLLSGLVGLGVAAQRRKPAAEV